MGFVTSLNGCVEFMISLACLMPENILIINLGESVGSRCLAIIWAEEKYVCEKKNEVCGEWVISRTLEPEVED